MTLAVFVVAWLLSLAWYGAYGPLLWPGGPTIYVASMWAVLATAAVFAIARSRQDDRPLKAVAAVGGVILYGWWFGWKIGPPGALHMLAHLVAGVVFLWMATERWQNVIGFLFLAGAAMSAGAVLGLWPARPRVFTGIFYPDAVAYLTHSILIVIGRAAGDDLEYLADFGPLALAADGVLLAAAAVAWRFRHRLKSGKTCRDRW